MLSTLVVDNEKFAHKEQIYRLKPQTDVDIIAECRNAIEALENALHHVRETSVKPSFIPCYKGNNNYLVNCADIKWAKSNPHTGVHLTLKDGKEYHTSKTLTEIEEKTALTRCHNQHLINVKYIKIIEKTSKGTGVIHTDNGQELLISRRCMDQYRFD